VSGGPPPGREYGDSGDFGGYRDYGDSGDSGATPAVDARVSPGPVLRPGGGRPEQAGPPAGAGPRRRPGRPHSRWRTAFFGLAVLATVVGVGWALLGNRLLVVRSVSVTGTRLLSASQVTAAADVPLGTPLLRLDTGAVARRVEAIPQVASATVSDSWPDGLVIAVTERVPVMAVKMAGGGYDQLDRTGAIVRWTQAKPALPRFVTPLPGSAVGGSASAAAAADVLAELQPWLARQVASVKASTVAAGGEQVTLSLQDGKTVRWGDTERAAQKNRELAILLPGAATSIDVSSPGTAVTHLLPATRVCDAGWRRWVGDAGFATPRRAGKTAGISAPRAGKDLAGPGIARVSADVGGDTPVQAAWRVDRAPSPPYCPYQS
jgi:cell division protein FtsQ